MLCVGAMEQLFSRNNLCHRGGIKVRGTIFNRNTSALIRIHINVDANQLQTCLIDTSVSVQRRIFVYNHLLFGNSSI